MSDVPERPPDKVLRCDCGFTTFEEAAARAHVKHNCAGAFELVDKST